MSSSSNKTWRWLLLGVALSGSVLSCLSLVQTPVRAAAGINQQLNFQGRLLNSSGATVSDGVYNIEFKIYQDGDGQSVGDTTGSPAGTLKWTENHLVSSTTGVTIKNGYLSVQLGSVNPFGTNIDWNQDTLWLSVDIGNTSSCTITTNFDSNCGGDGEMTPMKRLSSNPYAFNSGLLGGLASSQYVQLAQGLQTDTGNSVNSIYINKTGSGGNFIDLQASGVDAFTLTNSGNVTFGNNADHTVSVTTAGAGVAGKSLTISAGTAGSGGSALAGGSLTLQGGTGGGTNGNGGDISIDAGAPNGTGSGGSVNIGTANAATINIATNNAAHTIAIGNGTAVQGITIGSTNGASALTFQAGSGGIGLNGATAVSGSNTFATGTGAVTIQGATTVSASLTVTNAANVAFQKGTDFSTTGSSNDVNFGTGVLIRLTGASAQTITGIAGGANGRVLTLVNAASQAATLSNLSSSSAGANQVSTGSGSDISIPAGASIALAYDSGASLWRVVGSTPSTGNFVQLQGSSPGTQQSGNFNISGAGLLATLDATTNNGSLSIGASRANTIQLGNTTAATTLSLQGGTGASAVGIQAGASGTISVATTAQAQTIQIGTTSTNTGNTQTIGIGNLNAAGTTNVTIGTGSSATAGATTIQAHDVLTLTGTGGITATGAAASSLTTSAGALTVTSAAAATWSTAAGLLTVQGAGGVTVQSAAGTTSSNVTIASGNASAGASGNISIDNGTFTSGTPSISLGATSSRSITVGNATAGTTFSLEAGTGTTSLFNGNTAHTIQLATGGTSTAQSVTIGSASNTTSTLTLQAGTGATAVTIQTGNNGAAAGGIQIGNTTGAFTQTIGVGNNTTASSSTTLTLGSTIGGSQSALQGGTNGVAIDSGTGTITIGTSANNKSINIGAQLVTANTTTVNIANTLGNATQTVNIGSSSSASNAVLIQGGTGSSAISLQTGAGATIKVGTNNSANTIQIGSTSLSSGTQAINIGTNNTSGGTTNVTIGNSSSATAGATTIQAKDNVIVATNGVTRGTFDTSNNLYLGNGVSSASPNNFTIQGTASSATAVAGGSITLQGGAATSGNANGGSVTLAGGAGIGTGVSGLVNIGVSAFSAVTNSSCSSNCTLAQANIDTYSTIVVNATTAGITMTLPDPTLTATNGRIIYITAANGSTDFILETNSGGSLIDIAMRQNATATMVWNGTDWTAAGASNATTLQATYNNGTNPSTTPEIKLDSTHGTIDIQDADTTIGQDLFNIRASNAGNLGTVLLGVGNSGTVTIRNSTDQQAAFRFQNASSRYVLNVNTNSNYFINNGTRASGNDIINPGFEAGTDTGDTTFGEQGWFGSAQATVVNSSSNARSGNYELQVTPNGTNLDTYANGYFEVQPGDTIYFEGWVKNSAGANGTGGIELTFYDKDKANPTTSTNYSSLPGTSYVLKTVSATVPSGKYYVRASAAVRSAATSGTYYFDDFLLRRSNTNAPLIIANSIDSATAFQVQSAGNANTLFTADTTNNIVKVGDSTGSNTDTTILVLDSATANPTTLTSRDGGLFYRSDTNSIKAVIGGAVYDVCTTATVCTGYGASAGSVVSLQASSPGTQQTGNFNISGTGILTQLQTQDVSSASTNSSNLTVRTGNATGSTSNSGSLTLDVGTATGTLGTITIGHTGVATTLPGTLVVQGSNTLQLGTSSSAIGSIKLYNNVGSNTITLAAAGSNPTSSWTFTLPQNPGSSGDCLKDSSGTGTLSFGNCTAGATTTLQDAYNNSSSPATITLANSKNLVFTAQDTSTDPNVLVNLQCTTGCSTTTGRFAVQNGGTDVLTVLANNSGIVLAAYTQIGSSTTDSTQTNFQLDSYNGSSDSGTCSTTQNQGALYYNTTMGSIRGCVNGSWSDISNPDTLGLLTFGIVPSSGSNPYDLPALVTANVSGPCKVSRVDATHVSVQSCVAYSGGRRVNITANNNLAISSASLTTTNIWTHLCLDSTGSLTFTAANSSPTANLTSIYPSSTFNIAAPQLCLADIKGSATTGGNIAQIYDVRTFTSTIKEAVNFTTASELGMMADSSTAGLIPGASCSSGTCSGKLYGIVVSSDGSTSTGTPNGIVATVGPAYVKMTAGNAGEFIHDGPTTGYGVTVTSVPNNAFYYSAGNARTGFASTCTSASTCAGSVYVNMLVR